MVLVCGDPLEPVTAFFCSRLKALGIGYRTLDLGAAPDALSIEWSWSNAWPSGSMLFADSTVDFSEVTGVYFRNVLPDEPDDEAEKSEETVQIYPRTDPRLAGLLNSVPCRVVNRPESTDSNRSKPYQALIIRQFGFAIPKTLISNDPDAARHFYDECEGKLICKSMSGVRSIVRRVNKEDLGNFDLWADRPIQLQEYLPGDNIRVHVIGERVFAVRIQCEAVDYRYAGAEGYARTMVPETLPGDVATNCLRLTKEFGLAMSGIDLKETPAGQYHCFEVNTSPAFPFYESLTRPVIADALAEYLAGKSA